MGLRYCVWLFVVFSSIYAVRLPPEITKCNKKDPKFGDCMKNSIETTLKLFRNGNKELGFPPLEPFYVEKLELTADPKKSVRLDQKYDHIYMHGFTETKVNKFNLITDEKDCHWEMEIHTPATRMEADYQLSGQVLLFPLNGNGRCNVTLQRLTNKHMARCERYKKKGKTHMKLKDYTIDMKAESCTFDFPNIIPGNEQISREVSKTINENSLEIFKDVKGGFEEMLSRLHENAANSIFSRFPEEELFGA